MDRSFFRFVTNHALGRRTDRRAAFSSLYRVCIPCSADKNTKTDHYKIDSKKTLQHYSIHTFEPSWHMAPSGVYEHTHVHCTVCLKKHPRHFLAKVNSCSCSLYVVVRPSVCRLSVCRQSVVCRLSSVTFVHPTQAIEIFGNVSTPFGTLAICDPSVKILLRSSQGNPSIGGLNQREVEKCSDFWPFQGYISETVQDTR